MRKLIVFFTVLIFFIGYRSAGGFINTDNPHDIVQESASPNVEESVDETSSNSVSQQSTSVAESSFPPKQEYIPPIYSQKFEVVNIDYSLKNASAFFPPISIHNSNVEITWLSYTVLLRKDGEDKELDLREFVLSNLPPADFEGQERYMAPFPNMCKIYQDDRLLYLIFEVFGEAEYTATHVVCINLDTLEFENFLYTMPGVSLFDATNDEQHLFLYGSTWREELLVSVINICLHEVVYEEEYEFNDRVTGLVAIGPKATITLNDGKAPTKEIKIIF